MRGPVATMMLSHEAGGSAVISPRSISTSGWDVSAVDRERAAGGDLVGVARAHHQRAKPPHFLVQEADRIVLAIIGTERIGTNQLGQPAGLVGRRGPVRAHLVKHDGNAAVGDLPSRFAAREPAADDMNGLHCLCGYWKYTSSQPCRG